jgi:hypothetical protein
MLIVTGIAICPVWSNRPPDVTETSDNQPDKGMHNGCAAWCTHDDELGWEKDAALWLREKEKQLAGHREESTSKVRRVERKVRDS